MDNLCCVSKKEFIGKVTAIEDAMAQFPNAVFGDDAAPLVHKYGEGLYIRQVTMPAGMVLTSKIHKKTHPYFVLKGECDVVTEKGTVRIKAPYWGMTEAGTKRVLRITKETLWVTVHATKETDLRLIEAEIMAEDYESLPEGAKLCLG